MAESRSTNPARALALLWGPQDKVGRSGLSIRSIVTAAVELGDAEGLSAVSMRRVADKLGVGAMSLYTHVPGKSELVALMADTVLADLYSDVDEPKNLPTWRDGMRLVAERNWGLYLRHPWLLEAAEFRPTIGPNLSLNYEAELRPLDGIGLTDLEIDSVLLLVRTHVDGAARSFHAQRRSASDSGRSDLEWWQGVGPILEKVMDRSRFPVSGRVGSAAGEAYQSLGDPAQALDFGLARILDGVEMLLSGRR